MSINLLRSTRNENSFFTNMISSMLRVSHASFFINYNWKEEVTPECQHNYKNLFRIIVEASWPCFPLVHFVCSCLGLWSHSLPSLGCFICVPQGLVPFCWPEGWFQEYTFYTIFTPSEKVIHYMVKRRLWCVRGICWAIEQ